jgi:predicted hydrocarbon binding protein
MPIATKAERKELGNFSSTVCFKAVVVGIEEALGAKAAAIALIAAGRQRGKHLADELDLTNKSLEISLEELTKRAAFALGKEGTCLCIIDKLEQEDNTYKVYTRETICSAGEFEGSQRQCTFTMGAIQGFLEAFLGKRLRGKQIKSVLRGDDFDVLEYTVY